MTEQPFVCEVADCTLLGSPTPLGIDPDGRVILETAKSTRMEAMHRLRQLISSDGWFEAVFDLRGRSAVGFDSDFDVVFPLVKRPSFSYYHWVSEYLPKVRALEEYEKETGLTPAVMIESDSPGWLRESLELVGVPFDRCIEWDRDVAHVDRLVIATHREKSRGDFLHPSVIDYRWVRDRILSNIEGREFEGVPMSDYVYVSRRLTDDRRALNEDEVMDVLEPLGFVSYALEELSVAAQARLFSQAEVIVGPHGAGLLNLIFADESANVVDLINEDHLIPGPHLAYYYYVPATLLGVGYQYLSCEARGRDMIVDTDELETVVRDLL